MLLCLSTSPCPPGLYFSPNQRDETSIYLFTLGQQGPVTNKRFSRGGKNDLVYVHLSPVIGVVLYLSDIFSTGLGALAVVI